jgi:hypothetical protein
VGAGAAELHADALAGPQQRAPQPGQLSATLIERAADGGGHLDLRLIQLGLGVVAEGRLRQRQELLDLGAQLAAGRVEDLVLLLDAGDSLDRGC